MRFQVRVMCSSRNQISSRTSKYTLRTTSRAQSIPSPPKTAFPLARQQKTRRKYYHYTWGKSVRRILMKSIQLCSLSSHLIEARLNQNLKQYTACFQEITLGKGKGVQQSVARNRQQLHSSANSAKPTRTTAQPPGQTKDHGIKVGVKVRKMGWKNVIVLPVNYE